MARARVSAEIELEYEVEGPSGAPTILLVAGLGSQLTTWPPPLIDAFIAEGMRVVRFDNRDAGRSTVINVPVEPGAAARAVDGERVRAPYDLSAMAADVVGLLDHLDVERAHVVGASMGGMIAQHLAFAHGGRVASLTSVMSTTGRRDVGGRTPAARKVLLTPLPGGTKEEYVAASVAAQRVLSSPTMFDESWAREKARTYWERGLHPAGTARQLLAIYADGDRTQRLADVEAPSLVIHGALDPLIQLSGGEATAAAIPRAQLVVYDEMAHDLPLALCHDIADRILKLVHAAG